MRAILGPQGDVPFVMPAQDPPAAASPVAERHRQVAAAVAAYLDGPWRALPAAARLGPRLGGALVLALGAWPLGLGGDRAPLQIEIILADPEWARLVAEARPSELGLRDPSPEPAAMVAIRSESWLAERMAEAPGLWLRQRGVPVRDAHGRLPALVGAALAAFRLRLPAEIASFYRRFREGLEGADETLDPVGRAILLGGVAQSALALPLLCRGEPYPPPDWLAWHVGRVCPDGDEILGLLARLLTGPALERDAAARLRRVQDELLENAGYGEALVRVYHRLA